MSQLPLESLTIRFATAADAPAIGRCHHTCWRQTYRDLLSPDCLDAADEFARSRMWHQVLTEPAGPTVVVAETGDQVVGFAAAGPGNDDPPPRELELYTLYILQSWYGTGIGQRLFDAAVGARPCSLWVAEANGRAISFYRRQGFRPDGPNRRIEEWEGLPVIRMLRWGQ